VGYFLPLLRSFPARHATELRQQPTKPGFDFRVGTRLSPTVRLEIIIRIGVALIGNMLLMLWFRKLGMWTSHENEAWKLFQIAATAGITIVFVSPLIIRGKAEERVVGIILCMLPGYCLLGAAWSYWHSFL
jgi:hypothetical protein